jgi:hypothetical protein
MAATHKGNPISNTQALLLILLNPLSSNEAVAAVLGGFSSQEWNSFCRYLESHSLANLLYARLQQKDLLALVPPEEGRVLHEIYLANAARNLVILTRAAEALAALQPKTFR